VLIEEGISYKGVNKPEEYYLCIFLNRESGRNVIIYSTEGGVDIETVAEKKPHLVFREEIHPGMGIQPFQSRRIAFNLRLEGEAFKKMVRFLPLIYHAYLKTDASLVEINPLFKTSDNKIVAADAKITLDDNALFRHPE
jgi:succinyl-CoA synthetase beta subunit